MGYSAYKTSQKSKASSLNASKSKIKKEEIKFDFKEMTNQEIESRRVKKYSYAI